jgi:alpha-L-fucosidase 2
MAGLVLGVSCCIFYSFGFELNSLAMPLGAVGYDYVNLNVDSLWSGGPFENAVRFKKLTEHPDYIYGHFLMATRAMLAVTRQVPFCPWCRNCSRLFLIKAMGVCVMFIQPPILDNAELWADYTDIMGNIDNYGEYEVLASLTVTQANFSPSLSSYRRSLDIPTGLHTVTYEADGAYYTQ